MTWAQTKRNAKVQGALEKDQLAPYMAVRRSAAHQLAAVGATALLQPLVEAVPALLHEEDNLGRRPLHYAVVNMHTATARMLLRHGADAQAKDGSGFSAIDHACAAVFRLDEIVVQVTVVAAIPHRQVPAPWTTMNLEQRSKNAESQ